MKFYICIYFCLVSFLNLGQVSIKSEIQKAIKLYEKGEFDKSKTLLKKLISTPESLKTEEKIQIFNNLGNIYADQGKNPESLIFYQKALKLSRKKNKILDEGKILKNIGALYVSWKKFPEAENYYKQSLILAKRNKDPKLIADCYNNLGTVYEQVNELDKAKSAYFQALNFYKTNKSDLDVAMVYSNLAIVFKAQSNVKKSIEYNFFALDFAKKSEDLWMSAAISNNIGNAYSEMQEYDLAEKFCLEAIKLSKEIEAKEITIMAYESLAEMFEKKGDFKNAYLYSKKMISLNSEFLNSNQTQQFSELEVKFKTKEKEFENQKLKFEKKQIQRQNALNISIFTFVFILLLIIVIFIFHLKRQKLLNKKQKEMNLAVLESETKERFRIARDLHDSVGQMLSVIKMHLSNSNKNEDLSNLVDTTITEVRQISHNLIPEALNFGLKRALEELIEKTQIEGKISIFMNFNIDKNKICLSQDKELMLFRIIQELVGNTIKHAKASEIKLSLELVNKQIKLIFFENGIGFDLKKITQSRGLGWKNTYARLALLEGKIEISSEKNKGLIINIVLPNV